MRAEPYIGGYPAAVDIVDNGIGAQCYAVGPVKYS